MMKRSKKLKIKQEKDIADQEKDLTYYLHDRVELMHQVFGILKGKELKAMAPDSVRNLEEDDLQELCLEEVLGISSKRLCAILDGAPCPSDTNTSSSENSSESDADRVGDGPHNRSRKKPQEMLETISLDSISSDESIVATPEIKKKKHKCHKSAKSTKKDAPVPSGSKQKKPPSKQSDQTAAKEKKAADRAGMTVLELLELQARARAIRAQLALEKTINIKDVKSEGSNQSASEVSESEGEVQIKEEPQEVVEIDSGSEDDKRTITSIKNATETAQEPKQAKTRPSLDTSKSLTVRMPPAAVEKPTVRKIKLIRHKIVVSTGGEDTVKQQAATNVTQSAQPVKATNSHSNKSTVQVLPDKSSTKNPITSKPSLESNLPAKSRKTKQKRHYRKRIRSGERSDNDELIMEVSDGEKLDLFEGSDEPTSSGDDSDNPEDKGTNVSNKDLTVSKINSKKTNNNANIKKRSYKGKPANITKDKVNDLAVTVIVSNDLDDKVTENNPKIIGDPIVDLDVSNQNIDNCIALTSDDTSKEPVDDEAGINVNADSGNGEFESDNVGINQTDPAADDLLSNIECQGDKNGEIVESTGRDKVTNTDRRSEGELSDAPSSEVEMFEKPPEVLMISDEEDGTADRHKKKKTKSKKGKDKKHKKKDKQEKKSDFLQVNDQNFFELTANETNSEASSFPNNDNIIITIDENINEMIDETSVKDGETVADNKGELANLELNISAIHTEENLCSDNESVNVDFDDVIEILEISDESSSDECNSGLSKKPTAEEIIALGIKIEKQIEDEDALAKRTFEGKEDERVDDLPSWKERWLTSSKVQKVLTTSSILNALRKKNKELKKKLVVEKNQAAEQVRETAEPTASPVEEIPDVEGTVELYETLTGCSDYAESLQENVQTVTPVVAPSMAKDAKHLLKMYKRLLKAHGLLTKEDKRKIKAEKRSLKQLAKGHTGKLMEPNIGEAVSATENSVLSQENTGEDNGVTVNAADGKTSYKENIEQNNDIEAS